MEQEDTRYECKSCGEVMGGLSVYGTGWHKKDGKQCGPVDLKYPAAERGLTVPAVQTDPVPATTREAQNKLREAIGEPSAELRKAAESWSPKPQVDQPLPLTQAESDELWRATLAAELRPIALRAGRELFTLAATIHNASVGLVGIVKLAGQTRNELDKLHARQAGQAMLKAAQEIHGILDSSIATLIHGWVDAKGFTQAQVVEVQTDMARATQLAKAAPPTGIILPSGGH